jgi:hypothetical protein
LSAHRRHLGLLFATLLGWCITSDAAPGPYAFEDLGTVGKASVAMAVNDSGTVVGSPTSRPTHSLQATTMPSNGRAVSLRIWAPWVA